MNDTGNGNGDDILMTSSCPQRIEIILKVNPLKQEENRERNDLRITIR